VRVSSTGCMKVRSAGSLSSERNPPVASRQWQVDGPLIEQFFNLSSHSGKTQGDFPRGTILERRGLGRPGLTKRFKPIF
jgi:hypothetical protein